MTSPTALAPPCARCDRGVVKTPDGAYVRYVFCTCPTGAAAEARPCTCPTLADMVSGFEDFLEDLAVALPPLSAEEEAVFTRASEARAASACQSPACPLCHGNLTVLRANTGVS